MAAALEVEAELNLLFEIVFRLREGRRERRIAEKEIETENDDRQNEQRFPLEIRIHG